jgi:hypothetical protein
VARITADRVSGYHANCVIAPRDKAADGHPEPKRDRGKLHGHDQRHRGAVRPHRHDPWHIDPARSSTLDIDATLRRDGDELEIDAASSVDQRVLGITHNPLRMTGHPTKIVFRGGLVADG